MNAGISRRHWLTSTSSLVGAAVIGNASGHAEEKPGKAAFGYCLNTSTIRGQKIPIQDEVEIAAKAGYQAIEPWIRELDDFVKAGGNLKDLGKRIKDNGLVVPSSIGFAEWIVDDEEKRKKGLEEAKRNMDMLLQIGGQRLAAPPVGAVQQADLNLYKAGERYRALAELGAKMGVIPQVEVWGFSSTLKKLSETVLVAMESGHPQACILPDVYHLHKGGSDFNCLKLLGKSTMHIFHVNDFPRDVSLADLKDAHRVYPGDGAAPWKSLLQDLQNIGFNGYLSLELFNPDYWKQDAMLVAKTGLEKMKKVVQSHLS